MQYRYAVYLLSGGCNHIFGAYLYRSQNALDTMQMLSSPVQIQYMHVSSQCPLRSFLCGLRLRLLNPLGLRPIIPELDIAIKPQMPLLQRHALLLEDVFQGHPLIHEDLEVVGDDMPILAARARYQNRAFVVAVF